MRKIEEALSLGTNQDNRFPTSTPGSQTSPPAVSNNNLEPIPKVSTVSSPRTENASDVTLNLSCSLGSFPGSSIISLTFTEHAMHSNHKPDLISNGLISLEAAEEYFSVYKRSMEPCIYQILAENDCLANIRARSSLLTAAICAVGSFCADSVSHKRCYDTFIHEVSSRLFSQHPSFDDVCALCIGAFWLNKVSSTLIGLGMSPNPNDMVHNN